MEGVIEFCLVFKRMGCWEVGGAVRSPGRRRWQKSQERHNRGLDHGSRVERHGWILGTEPIGIAGGMVAEVWEEKGNQE